MAMAGDILAGRPILLVEDDAMVALEIKRMLHSIGVDVVGPAWSMKYALELIRSRKVDAAVVDLNLRDGRAEPALLALADRAIPFLVITGQSLKLEEPLNRAPVLTKPFTASHLKSSLLRIMPLLADGD